MDYPQFVDDHVYLDMDSSIPETDQLKAMLSNLTRIHLLTANKFEDFDELIREYLVSGLEVFGLETGIVSQVTEDGIYRICDVVSPIELLHKGQEFMLEDTYCREVVRSRQVLGFPEVGKLDYMNCHPVYQNLKLEAYLSAPIFVGDKLFGTLNFTSTTPRHRGFSFHEHNLILLMANSMGSFILLRNKEDRLKALNDRIKRFVGYVAHDLRNPLGSILGYARMGAREGLSEKRLRTIIVNIQRPAERALEFVSTILENAAISTGKFSLVQLPIKTETLFNEAVESVALFAAESGIQFELTGQNDVKVLCDSKRINQSLMNLLVNAIKYSPANSYIQLNASVVDQACKITINNTIGEKDDSESVETKKLYGSVGFGLDIVREVLVAHQSTLLIENIGPNYCVSFSLPVANG
ncbi:GAF domain-containing sensor histidine kinase [Teredinibacter purpureus]|uniref:GAF domain-containing sensor histidine kinase n=1 Tax=Teredinibacter purpureus TaxID=2731756 RepID=UPI0005F7DF3B|nr:GAF domain-containing sensor histidine kinase [Teredinibacter purpureus]